MTASWRSTSDDALSRLLGFEHFRAPTIVHKLSILSIHLYGPPTGQGWISSAEWRVQNAESPCERGARIGTDLIALQPSAMYFKEDAGD